MKVVVEQGAPPVLEGCTDAQLRDEFDAGTLARGTAYARAGAVTRLTVTRSGRHLVGEVQGSGRRSYSTVVSIATSGHWHGRCNCPVSVDCKHVVAVLVAARGVLQGGPGAAPAAAWEQALARLVEPEDGDTDVGLGLQLDVVAPGGPSGDSAPRVRLRPVRAGANGKWVRTSASWRDLESAYSPVRLRPAQREAVRALHGAWRLKQPPWISPYSDPQITLDAVGAAVWRLLADAEQTGVALLDASGRAVTLSSAPAEVVADVREDDDGVVLQAGVGLPGGNGGAVATLVGRPATGVFLDRPEGLLLAPFARPLDAATQSLLDAATVRVPAADLPRFYRRFYPALRQRVVVVSADGSVELPEVAPPRLALQVRFEPEHVTELEWSFGYPVAGEVAHAPLAGPCDDVVRDPAAERALFDTLAELPDVAGLWEQTAGGRRPVGEARLTGVGTARFASAVLPALQERPDVEVTVIGEPVDYAEATDLPRIAVGAHDDGVSTDWFDLTVDVSVAGQEVPLAPLLAALTAGDEHLVLAGGTWFRLDRPELQALRTLLEEARSLQDRESGGLRVSPFQAGLWEELVSLGVVEHQSERWSRTVGGLLGLESVPQPEPPLKLQAELRPYQQAGYAWLSLLWDLRLGGILADDMGLGKTLQTLAMAARAYEDGELTEPLLVVAPTSVVGAWTAEAERFCPDLPVVAVTETERRSGVTVADRIAGTAIVVTSYALLRIDEAAYLGRAWSGLVLDEAQHVKNHQSKTYSVARRVSAPVKLAITGTPLENSLMDLWSLLSITAPGLFPSPQRFDEQYRRPIESGRSPEQLAALRRRLRPLMLRRSKEQVATDLPPKIEQVVDVTLNPQHRRVYDKHLQRERQRVLGLLDDLQRNRFEILKSLTTLRQLSLDPSLVEPRHAAMASSKIDVLASALREVRDEGHRALVFSSFTGFLSKVRARLDADGIGYCYLDGRTRDRPRRIAEFTDGAAPVFLISLKAGGTGLTLTQADYVFILDPWWNPATEAQAVDRAHRIGQDKTVMVYRLVAADTIEEKVVALQNRKRELFTSVVDGEAVAPAALTADDIRALLG